MINSSELFSSPSFWFGTALLCGHQISRFSELRSLDPFLVENSSSIPNLRVGDFSGRSLFLLSLTGYLALTFLLYICICLISPDVIKGWLRLTGQNSDIAQNDNSYTLYVAATLMGLTQVKIPGLSALSDLQINAFYSLAGIPRTVVDSSGHYLSQIFARSVTRDELGAELKYLVQDTWINKISAFCDEVFYRNQLRRLKLDDDNQIDEIVQSSRRELKDLISQLVYTAALATVRASGRKGLPKLAQLLRVNSALKPLYAKYLLVGGFVSLLVMSVLWTVFPMLHGLSTTHLSAGKDFWPKSLPFSGQYLLGQALPLFICAAFSIISVSSKSLSSPSEPKSWTEIFTRYINLFVTIVVFVVIYDIVQALFDFGYFSKVSMLPIFMFVPIYVLHAVVYLIVSLQIVTVLSVSPPISAFISRVFLVTSVIVATSFYSLVRMYYQYDCWAWDFLIVVVCINTTSALLVDWVARLVCEARDHQHKLAGILPYAAANT